MTSTPIAATLTAARPAPLWRRFASMLYDLFPLIGLWIAASGLWMLAFYRTDDLQHMVVALQSPLDLALRDLWLVAITAAYFVLSWKRVGATIGMRAWRVRLLREDGSRVGIGLAFLRFVLALVSFALAGCGFWVAWFDADRRAWHDRVCGTRMIRM
ncbi:MAG: RDD family protein [Rhodanobacteraceae bacterium]